MPRVEWTRRSPEEIETVLGILLCRENPAAIRVRPAQGDHGIDVYVLREDGWVVYQIKSFATALTASHKGQITKSWDRFRAYAKENELTVKEWHLVRPINPTLPDTKWLAELTQGAEFPTDWKGLDFCEGLAAKYPDVLDYYLFDGKARLEETVRDFLVLAGFSHKDQVPIEPGDAYTSLEAIHDALNAFDPHFRYDFSVSNVDIEVSPQSYASGPGLVASVTRSDSKNAITFRIYARFREALSERELPGAFSVELRKDSAEAIAWQDFFDYGIGVDSLPVKNFTLKLPGNLGGEYEGGLLTIGSLPSEKPLEFDLIVLDTDGSTDVASTYAVMEGFTSGPSKTGFASTGQEAGGAFRIDLRVTPPSKIDFRIFDIGLIGKRPAEILQGYRFLAAFRHPHLFGIHLRHGPPIGTPHPIPSGLYTDDVAAADVIRVLEALATIQRHTHLEVLVPDLTAASDDEINSWLLAAKLLRGDSIAGSWNHLDVILAPSPESAILGDQGTFALVFTTPLKVNVGDQEIELGQREFHFPATRVPKKQPELAADKVRLVPGGDESFTSKWVPNPKD